MIGSVIQSIIEKPLIAIDRMGPIPTTILQSKQLSVLLNNKKIILLEEVVATGNELDRTILFLKT